MKKQEAAQRQSVNESRPSRRPRDATQSEDSEFSETLKREDAAQRRSHRQLGVPKARISREQKAYLESEFQRDPNWDRPQIEQLSSRLGLTYSKTYKWCWDKQKQTAKNLPSLNWTNESHHLSFQTTLFTTFSKAVQSI